MRVQYVLDSCWPRSAAGSFLTRAIVAAAATSAAAAAAAMRHTVAAVF